MSLYAELHRHLGGSVVPRVLWRYFERNRPDLSGQFADYAAFEQFYTRPRNTLAEYLELHTLVESVQTHEALPYFIYRLIRGAYIFENLAYLELRYTPYLRTPAHLPQSQRIEAMAEIVEIVGRASDLPEYPIVTKQILCMHSSLPAEVNRAIVELAGQYPQYVCAVDVAGGDAKYGDRIDEFVHLYKRAQYLGLKTTGHLYETVDGDHPALLPYLMRIGHGIQIPLRHPELLPEVAARGQCLEVCPTTYLKTGTLEEIHQLKTVFDRCFEAGVDIAICTDNAGLHNVRLPFEYENLLTHDVIGFAELQACQEAAFRHAFAWPHRQPPATLLTDMLQMPTREHPVNNSPRQEVMALPEYPVLPVCRRFLGAFHCNAPYQVPVLNWGFVSRICSKNRFLSLGVPRQRHGHWYKNKKQLRQPLGGRALIPAPVLSTIDNSKKDSRLL